MNCCVNCFNDSDLKARIKTLNKIGNCDFCQSQNVYVLNIKDAEETSKINIIPDFEDLLDQFTTEFSEIYADEAHTIADFLKDQTNIFNLKSNKISKFLKELLPTRFVNDKKLFSNSVIPNYLLDAKLQLENGAFKGHSWKEFEGKIRFENRFHSDMANDEILKRLFSPDLFTKICKIPIKHMLHAFDGYFAFSPFKCTKRASALI